MSDDGTEGHDNPVQDALAELMQQGWADPPPVPSDLDAIAPYAAKRRDALSARFPGQVLVIPTGTAKARANDTDHPFRAGSDYYWLTGDLEPDGVLVLVPSGSGHDALLHVPARSDRALGGTAFFTDRRYGELWVGPRRGPAEVNAALAVATAPRTDLEALLADHPGAIVLRGVDASVDAVVPAHPELDAELATHLSELRLIKDDLEVAMLQEAVDATITGFTECVAELRAAKALPNGERWIEGTFWRRARTGGNDVGYGSIVACGDHATVLHWTRDDGLVRDGELALLDMGVESKALYTADVTRTLPISGRFTPPQRAVYTAVWEAQQAAFAASRPGAGYLDPHEAAMRVLIGHLQSWGLLTDHTPDEVWDQGLHRRWTLHSTSHHLGIDVHDCAAAREEFYRQGTLSSGMVITIEPGLYFQRDDLLAPEELRGIGVRIEDDILITSDGCHVLSAALPTEASAVEAWMDEVIRGSAVAGTVEVTTADWETGPAAELRLAMEDDSRWRYTTDGVSPATAEQFGEAERGRFLLATIDGVAAGCAGIRAVPEVGPGVAEIKRMFTAPSARRRGVGAALLAACEDAARELGYTRVVLETGYMQPEAGVLYRSKGYTDVAEFGPYAGEEGADHLGKLL